MSSSSFFTFSRNDLFSKVVLLLIFALSVFSYKDYGIGWDENDQKILGMINLKYVFSQWFSTDVFSGSIPNLPDWPFKVYGPAFEMLLSGIEMAAIRMGYTEIFEIRHLFTFIFCYMGYFLFYFATRDIYKSSLLGLSAVLMIVLSPRFFAESFYNSKDLVFTASICICIYSFVKLSVHMNAKWILLHAITTAFSSDIRIMGVIIFFGTIVFFLYSVALKKITLKHFLLLLCCFTALYCFFMVMMFPFLWDDPLNNIITVFNRMSKYPWGGSNFYFGEFISAKQVPWHYIPIWIAITVPPFYTFLFVIGITHFCVQIARYRKVFVCSNVFLYNMVALGIFIFPIVAVVSLSSVLYDGWRQLYFIYPGFCLVAVFGLSWILSLAQNKTLKKLLVLSVLFCFLFNGYLIVSSHPLQNVYFNFLAGSSWKDKFEVDYWGLANKKALLYIVNHDSSDPILVAVASGTPLEKTIGAFKKSLGVRIRMAGKGEIPNYIISNYRWVKDKDHKSLRDNYSVFYEEKVFNETILTIFKRIK